MTYGVMGLSVMIYSGGDHQRTHICGGHTFVKDIPIHRQAFISYL